MVAAVIAIGADVYTPTEYLYGQDERVHDAAGVGRAPCRRGRKVANAQSVVMIPVRWLQKRREELLQQECCGEAVKNALKLKEVNPNRDCLYPVQGYENIRIQRGFLPGSSRQRREVIRYEAAGPAPVRAW